MNKKDKREDEKGEFKKSKLSLEKKSLRFTICYILNKPTKCKF